MTPKQFQKYLDRDFGRCWHCGSSGDDLVPHHRKNRQMGSKNASAEQDSNILVMCANFNSEMESSAEAAEYARRMNWKLDSWSDPQLEPVYDTYIGDWWILNNGFVRVEYDETKI